MRLGEVVAKVRSKNAGPFWVTVDVFCGDAERFARVVAALSTADVAAVFGQPEGMVRRFDIPDLGVVKFSFPRPVVQGSAEDRDMHGAQWAHLLAEMTIA
ncbi:MAG: DUF4387 family protein [Gemmobacter sp.]